MAVTEILNQRVGKLVAGHPQTARVFEKYRIDYCCRGNTSLAEACQERQIELSDVLQEIEQAMAEDVETDEVDWSASSLASLADHIEQTHHLYLRKALPRLSELIAKVTNVHGEKHPELSQVKHVFAAMREELESHMMKEEQVLFPAVRAMESSADAMSFPFGSLSNPIQMMELEHDEAGAALEQLSKLTSNYEPPPNACPTYCVMLDSLAEIARSAYSHSQGKQYSVSTSCRAGEC